MIGKIVFCRLLPVIFYLTSGSLYSQNPIDILLQQINRGSYSFNDLSELSENQVVVLAGELQNNLPQFTREQRLLSYRIIYELSSKVLEEEGKNRLIDFLVLNGLVDQDVANRQAVVDQLYFYKTSDFSISQLNFIASRVVSLEEPHLSMVRLAGWLGIDQLETFVKQKLGSVTEKKSQWIYHLFLGRMGDPISIQYCVERIRRLGMNDNVVYSLIPDLLYLHQREAIDFILVKILDDEKLCTSPNPDYEVAIPCAYRLIELVAPVVVDFPVKTGPSGDLEVTDYPKALEVVRQWIEMYYDTYQLQEP